MFKDHLSKRPHDMEPLAHKIAPAQSAGMGMVAIYDIYFLT